MNWLHFFMWLGGIYILYYLAVLLLDVAGAKTPRQRTPLPMS
jgi:hypothetical protein